MLSVTALCRDPSVCDAVFYTVSWQQHKIRHKLELSNIPNQDHLYTIKDFPFIFWATSFNMQHALLQDLPTLPVQLLQKLLKHMQFVYRSALRVLCNCGNTCLTFLRWSRYCIIQYGACAGVTEGMLPLTWFELVHRHSV